VLTCGRPVELPEPFEDVRDIARDDPHAAVDDIHAHLVVVLRRTDHDGRGCIRILQRVVDQVTDHESELRLVARPGELRWEVQIHLAIGVIRQHLSRGVLDRGRDIYLLDADTRFARLYLRYVQEVLDQPLELT